MFSCVDYDRILYIDKFNFHFKKVNTCTRIPTKGFNVLSILKNAQLAITGWTVASPVLFLFMVNGVITTVSVKKNCAIL